MQHQPAIIDYHQFKATFDNEIFSDARAKLVQSIADRPERYVGLFRATLPETKLRQNLLQSHEIRFGNAFEKVLTHYLIAAGWQPLISPLQGQDKNQLEPDLLLHKSGQILLAEVKVRDDHDSTKKRGQIENFRQKVFALLQAHGPALKLGFFHFIDPNMVKNKNYYRDSLADFARELRQPSSHAAASPALQLHVTYGPEFFNLLGLPAAWEEIVRHLHHWRSQLPREPDLNFDNDPAASAAELIKLSPRTWEKLFDNAEVVAEILPVIFPWGTTLRYLLGQLQQQPQTAQVQKKLQLINDYLQWRWLPI